MRPSVPRSTSARSVRKSPSQRRLWNTASTRPRARASAPSSRASVGSSMDESAIRDALSGNFLNHVEELAKLTATSITIPEMTFTTTASMEGTTEKSTAVYKNLVLSNIKDGVAETVTMDSVESNSTGGKFAYGKMTYNNWNLAGSMALAGLVPGASSDFSQIIGSYKIDGATFSGSGADCTLGAWSGAESDARPVTVLLKDVIAAGQELQAAPKAAPPPAAMKTVAARSPRQSAYSPRAQQPPSVASG